MWLSMFRLWKRKETKSNAIQKPKDTYNAYFGHGSLRLLALEKYKKQK